MHMSCALMIMRDKPHQMCADCLREHIAELQRILDARGRGELAEEDEDDA